MTQNFRPELSGEPGYLTSQIGPNQYRVFKVDPAVEPVVVLAKHVVQNGVCDCEGFKHRAKCRHVEMVQWKPKGVDRMTARADVTHVVNSWGDRFSRVVFGEYEFSGPDEEVVLAVKLKAYGKPIEFQGVKHYRITGITKAGTFVVMEIEE
jgi:hypothetical protein